MMYGRTSYTENEFMDHPPRAWWGTSVCRDLCAGRIQHGLEPLVVSMFVKNYRIVECVESVDVRLEMWKLANFRAKLLPRSISRYLLYFVYSISTI